MRRTVVGLVAVIAFAAALLVVLERPERERPPRAPMTLEPAPAPILDPTGSHFLVAQPADLTGAEAHAIYERIRQDLGLAYRLSGHPEAARYLGWKRHNRVPFRSETHGARFVNTYGNRRAQAYGDFERAGTMPVGAVLAKDSFAVTADGEVYAGPLALMEKMPEGFSPETRDWRYSLIMPDGEPYGTTGGEGDERVRFCADCHALAGDDRDHLYLMPERYRAPPELHLVPY